MESELFKHYTKVKVRIVRATAELEVDGNEAPSMALQQTETCGP
jgi:hypothetical protein